VNDVISVLKYIPQEGINGESRNNVIKRQDISSIVKDRCYSVIVYIPPNSYVELLTPKVLGSGSLGV
jgi:hypothetical protein